MHILERMMLTETEPMGKKIRRQRRRLGFTLDELAARTRISKPYLSLIETGRVANPPSDEKLRRLEEALSFAACELVQQAHLQRTPEDVRQMLARLAAASPAEKMGTNDLPAAAWAEVQPSTCGMVSLLENFSGCPEAKDPATYAARVEDDSMTPKFGKGDVVIFSPTLKARSGDDCLVRLHGGRVTFQRIFIEESENQLRIVRLQPRNERFRPVVVPSRDIAAAHRAIFRYQRIADGI